MRKRYKRPTAGLFAMGMAVRRARAEIPVPPVPDPLDVVPTTTGYAVGTVARVDAGPHRGDTEARRLAARIALRPLTYLPLLMYLGTPGVTDLRPTFGREVAHG